ncbi:MAG TPA: DUF883 domain-containing protein, partial [Burkholderiaceae bacterium]
MQPTQIRLSSNSVKHLLEDAQALFADAASLTGSTAEDLRTKGIAALEQALRSAHDLQEYALVSGKE